MNIPKSLYEIIERLCEPLSLKELQSASRNLSNRYREGETKGKAPFIDSQKERLAYLAVRFPATYSAVSKVLTELKNRCQDDLINQPIQSVLDLGAGPGTCVLAASSIFSSLKKAVLIERDAEMSKLGKQLVKSIDQQLSLSAIQWRSEELKHIEKFEEADLVMFSYALNETDETLQESLLKKAWPAAKRYLVVIEPGTKDGFASLKRSRDILLKLGAKMVAPCPHAGQCPMPQDDWCHFNVRLGRFLLHKRVKEGDLGWEDEKFSYVIVSRVEPELPDARILRHPQFRPGHILLSLCTKDEGLINRTYSKKMGALYKEIKKSEWGDAIEQLNGCEDERA